ncbi:MAG: DNA-binding GntR family transcriptional regulator [Parasphingorhabdus sp.]|jgi:DNA-binding GntR family transcriptional regulator
MPCLNLNEIPKRTVLMSATSSKKEHFYNDLKRRILTLDLAPGMDLDEVALSKEYEISRTPLRDVLRNLAGEGYLNIRNNRGARVSSMDQRALRDFFLVAPMIYAAISRLAAQNARAEQIQRLEETQQLFVNAVAGDDIQEKVFYNDQFHTIIGEMADNVFLQPSLRRLLIDHARIAQTFYQPTNDDMLRDLESAVSHHDEMIEAFRARDEDASAKLANAHWELSRKRIEKFVTPDSFDIALGK